MDFVTAISVFNAREAIDYYKEVFKADIVNTIVMMQDMPGYKDKYPGLVAHAELKIGDKLLYVNDILNDEPQKIGNSIQFCLYVDSVSEFSELRKQVSQKSKIIRDTEEEYWGAYSFSIEDPYQVIWHIYYVFEKKETILK